MSTCGMAAEITEATVIRKHSAFPQIASAAFPVISASTGFLPFLMHDRIDVAFSPSFDGTVMIYLVNLERHPHAALDVMMVPNLT